MSCEKNFKNNKKNNQRFYAFNFALIFTLIFAIVMNFVVQFKVEGLQDGVKSFEVEISEYDKQLDNLEVEWAFLTRPSRLRSLSEKYLTENIQTQVAQIKSDVQIQKFFASNHKLSKVRSFAMAE